MAAGVILGAFGAHGLKSRITPDLLAVYQTGVEYHMYHGLGVILIALLAYQFPQASGLLVAGWIMVAGVVVFSGSLYVLALTGIRALGAITPLGGVAFIVAWLLAAWSVLKIP